MGHPRGPFNWEGWLTLRDIEADEDLVPLLHCWHGEHLYVENCPGFNDAILNMMATVEDEEYSCAPYMGDLNIADSPNFSGAALRCLVSARFEVVDGRACPGIGEICVSGLAPDILTEEYQQILQYVYQFDYDPASS
jgi:hypothetical protein